MSDCFFLEEHLSTCVNTEDAFPVFLHSHVSRNKRLSFLKELVASHKVYENPDNGIKYVLDYSIAKHLFASPNNAIRYTALITDIESDRVDYIENILEYFPVFSDGESYNLVYPHATKVKAATEERIDKLDLFEIISGHLDRAFEVNSHEINLLQEIKSLNAEIALKALHWDSLLSIDELLKYSKYVFNIFRGDISSLLNEDDIDNIYLTLSTFAEERYICECLGSESDSLKSNKIMSAIFAQWVSGFLTPCVTWIVYTFLRRFDTNIINRSGNYGCVNKLEKYQASCLNDFIPFQAIHRLVTRDNIIDGVQFHKGEFVCIIPDALQFSTDESIISSVIGAPNRPCMGIKVSSKIVDAFENYFLARTPIFSTWNIHYELIPSLSALEFSELTISKEI